ncbi:hypothetical protein FLK61_23745 [Paenalkalicoccus suaedae]|uniref:GGDEF domain-containing protein n=1 Tax=Paenalkalicoccus suaedae TaxID=2592382 RepID=A0A859FA74_9BACI|nr:hypothetical protein [Paenalkalicoccus suaedae]QKS69807.1 hypothetical protein FLK61_23745 [Paenalkalicoccus suaedae]
MVNKLRPTLLIFLLVGFLVGHLVLNSEFLYVQIAIIILASLLMVFLSTAMNFVVVLSASLLYGFYLTGIAFFQNAFDAVQYQYIGAHLLLVGALLSIWLLLNEVKVLQQDRDKLTKEVNRLRKQDDSNLSLTYDEFMYVGKSIEVSMRRRREIGILMYVQINDTVNSKVESAFHHHLLTICLNAIRENYDILMSPTSREVIILLQHTTQEGATVVKNRIESKMSEAFSYRGAPISVEMREVGDLEQAMDSIHHLRRNEVS